MFLILHPQTRNHVSAGLATSHHRPPVVYFQGACANASPRNPLDLKRGQEASFGVADCVATGVAIGDAVLKLLPSPSVPSPQPSESAKETSGSPAPGAGSTTMDVPIVQRKGEKLGFTVREIAKGPNGVRAVVLSNLTEGELAAQTGKLRVGQAILKINGQDVKDLGPKETKKAVKTMIKAPRPEGTPLTFTVTVDVVDKNAAGDDEGAAVGVDASETISPISVVPDSPGLVVRQTSLKFLRRRVNADVLEWARVQKVKSGSSVAKRPQFSTYGSDPFGPGSGSLEGLFKSAWWANVYAAEVVACADADYKSPSVSATLTVIAYGLEWAIVCLPCDLFVELAEEIQRTSPFKHTAINTFANGDVGYVHPWRMAV